MPYQSVFAAALLFVTSLSVQGCIVLTPFISAWKNVGASSGDRQTLFNQEIKRFSDALYWGKGEAVAFLHSEAQESVRRGLQIDREKFHVVDSKVAFADFQDDAYTAHIDFKVRYYQIPFYIVKESTEKQVWKFSLGGAWRLVDRIVPEGGLS
jgi:hypothetical protein